MYVVDDTALRVRLTLVNINAVELSVSMLGSFEINLGLSSLQFSL